MLPPRLVGRAGAAAGSRLPTALARRRAGASVCACAGVGTGAAQIAGQSRSIATSAPRSAEPPAKKRPLPPLDKPQPVFTWKADSVQEALRNARLRQAPFSDADADRLGSANERHKKANEEWLTARQEAEAAGHHVREAVKAHGKPSDEVREAARTARERERELARQRDDIEREALALRLRLPNKTRINALADKDGVARLERCGGPAFPSAGSSVLPEQWRETWQSAVEGDESAKEAIAGNEKLPDPARDHVELLAKHAPGALPAPAAADVAPTGFPHLGEPLANMALALESYAIAQAQSFGARLRLVPDVVPSSLVALSGFAPRDEDAAQVYTLSTSGVDRGLSLAGTAELPLLAMHAGRTYTPKDGPIFEVALSHSFRAEAGARGRESRGLFRVNQFSKAELFVVCHHSDSRDWLEKLVDVQLSIIRPLGLVWRVLDMPPEELGASAFRKYDIEVFMPGRGSWGEVSSASNCTDFQTRRTLTRISGKGKSEVDFAHTLNATAAAVPRLLVAIIETHGFNERGQVRVPDVLRRYWLGAQTNVEWLSMEKGVASSEGSGDAPRKTASAVAQPAQPARRGYHTAPPPPESKRTVWERSVARVRAAAARSGTDPGSMVVSFAVLHELSAVLPLFLVFWILSALGAGNAVLAWLLPPTTDEEASGGLGLQAKVRGWVDEGARRAERYGRRKGWFGFEKGSAPTGEWSSGQDAGTVLAGSFADAVAAYAIVKALFPLRIAACIALAGPFARLTIEPVKRVMRRWRGR